MLGLPNPFSNSASNSPMSGNVSTFNQDVIPMDTDHNPMDENKQEAICYGTTIPIPNMQDTMDALGPLIFEGRNGFGFGASSDIEEESIDIQPNWVPNMLSVLLHEERIPGDAEQDHQDQVVSRDHTWFPFKTQEVWFILCWICFE
jgi:hypothetical protein